MLGNVGVDGSYLSGALLILSFHVLLELLALQLDALPHDLLLLLGQLAREDVVLPHRGDSLLAGDELFGIDAALRFRLTQVLLQLLLALLLPLAREDVLDVVLFDGHSRFAIRQGSVFVPVQ